MNSKTILLSLKRTILSALWLGTVTATAQPMAEPTPGTLRALPELHFAQTPASTPRRAAIADNRVKVVMANGQQPRRVLRTVADADASRFEGRTVFGAMVNSNLWANMSITEVPYGIYSFAMCGDDAPKSHISDMGYNFMSGAWGRDRHYGIVPLSVLGVINGARYVTIDTRDWRETKNVFWSTDYGTYSLISSVMAYDPTSDDFYAFQYKEDLTGLNWVRLNQATDQMEQVAQYRGTTAVLTLAATPDGQMYYIDTAGDLYTINKQSGRTSLVGNTGVEPTNYNQSMVYDGKTGTFLWAAQSTEGSVLYSVDVLTAETQRVMRFLNNEQFVSLYITDTEAPAEAPAAVGRPQLKADGNGSLSGNITFTVPSRTYGGESLTGDVRLNVWLDGENLRGDAVSPGTATTIPVTMTEGNHYIAITTDNEAGFSPLRYIYQYVGYDTPKAATDAVFVQSDRQNTVTWQAPTAGINGGYIDAANLTYDIVRMPDSVTVATGVTATTFTEDTPSAMHSYSYRVIADNHGHKAQYVESNRILCGDAFTVPYEQLFSDPATLTDYFTVVDNDGDGNTWRQGYTTEVRMDYFKRGDADDWLISPPIQLEPGTKYRFTMNMKTFTPQYPETFEVLIGTDPTQLSTFRLLQREENYTMIASEFGDYTTDFLVDDSQTYHMAVRYCSTMDQNASLMMIHNFKVIAVGHSQAPAQPSFMAVTPDADDALQATITLTAPQLNLMGDPLGTLTSVELYRDDDTQPLHTFDSPEPGQSLTFIDTQVPMVGVHTYTAVAINSAGAGEPLTQEQFIGAYTAPYATDFSNSKDFALWTKEYTYTDDLNNWWGWQWKDNENTHGQYVNLYYYLMTDTPTDIWLFTPKFRLDADAVYTINYDIIMAYDNYPDITYGLYQGTAPVSTAMDKLIAPMPSTGYFMTRQEMLLVNGDAGRYYLGIKGSGGTKADYFSVDLDNFSLTYRTSARSPYMMTNYQSEADATAALRATLSLTTPTTDYRRQPLDASQSLTVKIFRGQHATMPAATLSATPGQQLTWTDEQALHGLNYYTITCENEYGRGEVLYDTLFVGRDLPALVENYTVRGSADNKDAVISWRRPSVGANGGVVLQDELTYNVYSYDIESDELTLLAEGLTATTYTVERAPQATQSMYYYAVSAVNTEGESQASAASVILGQPYDLPFRESFAGAMLSTQLWQAVPMVQGATSCGLTNPTNSYNECNAAQDDDGGCIYFYNGYQYEIPVGALLITPKVSLSKAPGNELRFWAYHFKEPYSTPAYLQVGISTDDNPFAFIPNATVTVGGEQEDGWTEHVVSLDRYRNTHFVSLAVLGITCGYQDVIYLDNLSIDNPSLSGISETAPSTIHQSPSTIHDLQGRRIDHPRRGLYIKDNKKFLVK